ncbi:MAG: hypothetical protein ACK4N5_11440, partial [Myxococcales bacterium]
MFNALPLLLLSTVASAHAVTLVKDRNALTLPAQRHLVRMETGHGRPATWLLALQLSGQDGRGLELLRSDDEAHSWRPYAALQPDPTHQDRADLLAVGDDLALVWSFEDPIVEGSSRHDVFFQWWRHDAATHEWRPQPAVRVFDATSNDVGYVRAELARDSRGRLWVQAWKLERSGSYTAVVSVSEDGGRSFREQPPLASLPQRGGGRLISLGQRLMLLYDMHHDSRQPAKLRLRDDEWPVNRWTDVEDAFPRGIYHGAAMSAVADGAGGLHVVFKQKLGELVYRHFDGVRFGEPTVLLTESDWAVQPAITLVGEQLYVFFNRPRAGNRYDVVLTVLSEGRFSPLVVLDDGDAPFKGYPAAAERLPVSVPRVPCLFGWLTRSGVRAVYQLDSPHT